VVSKNAAGGNLLAHLDENQIPPEKFKGSTTIYSARRDGRQSNHRGRSCGCLYLNLFEIVDWGYLVTG
jgi:hypothetical protein